MTNMDAFALDKPTKALMWVCSAFFVAIVIYAVRADYLLFADGGFFSFALASGHAWEFVWRQFPTRIGAFLCTQGIPLLMHEQGFGPRSVAAAYQLNMLLVPLAGIAATWAVTRHATWTAWSFVAMCCLSFPLFGFPSEIYVTASLVTPVFGWVACGKRSLGAGLVAYLAGALFVFSHDAALLCLPPLAYLAWHQSRLDRARARPILAYLLWLGCFAAAMLLVKVFYPPTNPHVATAVAKNAKTVFQLGSLKRPLPLFAMLGLCFAFLWGQAIVKIPGSLAKFAAALGLGLILAFAWTSDLPRDRYDGRTAILWLMLGLAALYALRIPLKKPTVVFAACLFSAMCVVHVKSIKGWQDYVAVQARDAAMLHFDGAQWSAHLKEEPHLAKYYWPWSAPYTALAMWPDSEAPPLLIDTAGWYAPMSCQESKLLGHGALFRASGSSWKAISQDVCKKTTVLP